jgi:hypothetical protein
MTDPIPLRPTTQEQHKAALREAMDEIYEFPEIDGWAVVAWNKDGAAVGQIQAGSILPSLAPEFVKQVFVEDWDHDEAG